MPSIPINWFRLVLPLRWSRHWHCPFPTLIVSNYVFCDNNLVIKEKQFVRMLVINEVTIDTHTISIKLKEYLTDDFRSGQYTAVCWSIRSTTAMLLLKSQTPLAKGTKDFVFEPFFLLWTDNMPFVPSRADDKSSTDRLSIHFPGYCITWKK